MIQKERCIVTGGAGFIGSHLAEELVKLGNEVIIIDDLSTGKKINIEHINCTFVQNSISDEEILKAIIKEGDIIFHLAAIPSVSRSVADPLTTHDAGITATLKLLIAARDAKAKRVILASSSSVYGDTKQLPKHEEMPHYPLSPYALTKAANEHYARLFYELYGLQTISLRYFNVFGPRQDLASKYAAVIPLFITAALKGEQPTIYGDGKQTRDFTYIENVVRANLLAAAKERTSGQAVNIAAGKQTSVLELLHEIASIMGITLVPQFEEKRLGDVLHSYASVQKAKELLQFEPSVQLRAGLTKTIAWYQDQEKPIEP